MTRPSYQGILWQYRGILWQYRTVLNFSDIAQYYTMFIYINEDCGTRVHNN